MSLADRIDALRRQHQQRRPGPRIAAPAGRPVLHGGGRFARWHVEPPNEPESESWLLTYLDLITLLLAMLVVLLAVSKLPGPAQAADLPVELVGSVAQAGAPPAAWAALDTALTDAMAALAMPGHMAAAAPQTSGTLASPDAIATDALAPPVPSIQQAPGAATSDAPPAEPAEPEPAPPTIAELGLDDLGDGVDVIVNEKSISFRISNELLFPSGQAMLSPNGLGLIQRMAGVINRSQGYPVSVEGHSDPVPIQTRQFPSNWELSAGRAASVLRELVRDGVAPARLRAVGYADTRPIASNDTSAGRAANRRVELIMEITPRHEHGNEMAALEPG
ncbi:OmpA family protein [Bordetella sp. BOR01]|uniref:OmpA/MotB family protein n=1 Tax=Bordetella sp. BOR01 TaxID=2854779 RepID=UPI001C480C5A|nr:OmpA family protein [Bordetella sp. BOR01]MBV7482678.1 OmpA family protein [Bordetella sp. BOR01]